MRLRPSQIETLSLALNNGLTPEFVAQHFGITERSAQGRLDRLAKRRYLEKQWFAYWLTRGGEGALLAEGVARQKGEEQ